MLRYNVVPCVVDDRTELDVHKYTDKYDKMQTGRANIYIYVCVCYVLIYMYAEM